MSYLKTKKSNEDVFSFLDSIEDKQKRQDSLMIIKMFEEITNFQAKMWGAAMIGFGDFTYKTKANKIGEWFLTGFSPRKNNISFHFMIDLENETELLSKLGKHTLGKGCVYIKKLSDVDTGKLKMLMKTAFEKMKESNN